MMPLWTPEVRATVTRPGGVRDVAEGVYWLTAIEDAPDYVLCGGYGLVRLTGAVTRGSGLYMLDLPFAPFVLGDGWYRFGSVTLGFSDGQHRSSLGLHCNGMTDPPGLPSPDGKKCAVITPNDYLFATESVPRTGQAISNFHWRFAFPMLRPT